MTESAPDAPQTPLHEELPIESKAEPKEAGHYIEQTNGHGSKTDDEEPPSKRRRVETPTKPARLKMESPPWKKIEAEGPSSFTQDGKRKSGRVNQLPLDVQLSTGKQRQTRGAIQKTYSTKAKNGSASGNASARRESIPTTVNGNKGTQSAGSSHQINSPAKPVEVPKRSHKKKVPPNGPAAVPEKRFHKKKVVPADGSIVLEKRHHKKIVHNPQHMPEPARSNSRRSQRAIETDAEAITPKFIGIKTEDTSAQTPTTRPRIRLRVKAAELPLTHPGQVVQRPQKYPTLKEFLESSVAIPVEEGGLYSVEDAGEYSAEAVARDAQLLVRLEEAALPGGLLNEERCSVYMPEEQPHPSQQYSHLDHLVKAALSFRRLMLIEERKHKQNAKRIAEACRDEWVRKQPKSIEQLEAEEEKASQIRYKNLVRTLQATWDNVKAEVNRRRLLEWEAQEQARVRKALNEAVDISTQKLEARRARHDSELGFEDEDEEDDEDEEISENGLEESRRDEVSGSGSGTEDGESNMSSESEADDEDNRQSDLIADETLSVEQLREKYAALPSLPTEAIDEPMNDVNDVGHKECDDGGSQPQDDFEDSDESVDMDDDMGSSDEDRDSEDQDESEEKDDETDGVGASDLLGFLASTDVESMKLEAEAEGDIEPEAYGDVVELDQVGETEAGPEDAQIVVELDTDVDDTTVLDSGPSKHTELVTTSPDRSSQPTPITMETKTSETDSASSVDVHHVNGATTQSATPQPGSELKTSVPFLMRGTLREYQHYGLDWLAGLYANNTNGILADEMGLGKTIQTISLLAHLACVHEVWGPHLIIVPTSVMLNWEMEFKKFCPGFKILTYYGSQEERKRKRLGWKQDEDKWNVIITSYQLVLQDQSIFKRRKWHYMILDEAHNIKNFQSQRWQAMLTFNTRARLLLTGTPLQNNLTELWSLLYFLMPSGMEQSVGGFANLKEFQDWFKKPSEQILEHGRDQMDDEARAIISKLHKVLRPYLLRRLKADVEKQMPAKYEHVEFCRLSKRQRELYDGFLNREDTRGTLASGNYLSIINCLMQLRKVCNHPDLFIERAIMTSFPMERSVVADYEIKDLLVRRQLLREDPMSNVSLEFLNLVPTQHEVYSGHTTSRVSMLSAQKTLMELREAQRTRAQNALANLETSTAKSNLVFLESTARWSRFEELQHCVYLNALRRQQKPTYGKGIVELLTIGANARPLKPRPKRRDQMMLWLEDSSPTLQAMVPTIDSISESYNSIIQKFACVTPPVIARDLTPLTLSRRGVDIFQRSIVSSEADPFHEARMKLSIQFPDKRLLQYDCGKLQTLAKLLRRLQDGGHRALIFTQMTKVLDILEQFLNIHGYKYLRLDGSTKVEQRQILTDRFNNDNRILVFILSSRSGGLGINLTGADTVIFYDLDWNPAMDKQCQDRCHRIGQTRDVHIYRLVSEHTIEANILRKANQKRMLDDVVIQEGDFTTDYFNKASVHNVMDENSNLLDGDAQANAAMDRVLGGPDNTKDVTRVLAQAEDQEDVVAARIAEREVVTTDAADFDENAANNSTTLIAPGTPLDAIEASGLDTIAGTEEDDEINAWGLRVESTDDYMINFMAEQLKDAPVELPKDKNKGKRGRDRNRSHRAR
ncbi:SNF2 family N-terminal domain-containing protein [Calycina marina]|uniref:DNA helicase n=1 Tax=Calycina marina TaxID=1763456 RepID=A0A9P8CJ03_9HELO|nr:SNF2 family N-terminal domain-containing protein [Calycina marina]